MAQWSGKTIGPLLGYKIFIYIIRVLGVKPAYFLLNIVTFYYFLFAKKSRQNVETFYKEALKFNPSESKKLCRANFRRFGQTLVDRVAFLLGKDGLYSYNFDNEQALVSIARNGEGGVLLSAHLGNWETAGNLLRKRVSNKVNVLMLDEEVERVKNFMNAATGGSKFNIIPIKNDLSHIIAIRNALQDNELIAIHADRVKPGMKMVEVNFCGRKTKLPYGPFLVASKFKVPVTFVYALKDGNFHYNLSATNPVKGKSPEEFAQLYANVLEDKLKTSPDQWYNYYNFFNYDSK